MHLIPNYEKCYSELDEDQPQRIKDLMMDKKSSPVDIIAVQDVKKTSRLLCSLFDWSSAHGGPHFDILMTDQTVPALMLHEYDAHHHKRFAGIKQKSKGVGHSLYVFVDDIDKVYRSVKRRKLKVIEPLWLNDNSKAREFTFQIAEGYQFTPCETDTWLYYNV